MIINPKSLKIHKDTARYRLCSPDARDLSPPGIGTAWKMLRHCSYTYSPFNLLILPQSKKASNINFSYCLFLLMFLLNIVTLRPIFVRESDWYVSVINRTNETSFRFDTYRPRGGVMLWFSLIKYTYLVRRGLWRFLLLCYLLFLEQIWKEQVMIKIV